MSTQEKEWTGAYSDSDMRNWTPELKEKVGFVGDRNDAIFFMQWSDFLNYFRSIYICHYRNDFVLSSVPDVNDASSIACYQFNLTSSGDCYFGVSQPGKRKFNQNHVYGNLGMIICKVENGGAVKFVCGKGGKERDSWSMANCTAGKYIAFLTTSWNARSMNENKFSFWIYGKEATKIVRIQKRNNLEECQALMAKGLADYVIIFVKNTVLG